MSILAQVPVPNPDAAEKVFPTTRERWERFVEFWNNFEWKGLGERLWQYVQTQGFWIDFGAVIACALIAVIASYFLRRSRTMKEWYPMAVFRRTVSGAGKFPFFLVVFALMLWVAVAIAGLKGFTCPILRAVTIIYTGYLAVHLPNMLAPGRMWIKPMAIVIVSAAIFYQFGVLDEVVDFLDGVGIDLGEIRISLLSLILGPAVFLVAYGIGRLITGFAERRILKSGTVPPSISVLIGKVMQIIMVLIAIGITLGAVGINLTAITVFGGALGLGVGFGLQKVVSNLLSGVIILLDKSIKPGDVIEIGDTYGRINGLRTRYVSVITRDKKEFLIPNEDFITQPVINWSFSDQYIRLRVPIGVSYDTDIRQAIRLAEEAAAAQERIRKNPPPRCLMRGFGDSAINLELRFWILDPGEGCGNITSEVLLTLWDSYREHGVEIPFPQTELRLRSGGEAIREIVAEDHPDAD